MDEIESSPNTLIHDYDGDHSYDPCAAVEIKRTPGSPPSHAHSTSRYMMTSSPLSASGAALQMKNIEAHSGVASDEIPHSSSPSPSLDNSPHHHTTCAISSQHTTCAGDSHHKTSAVIGDSPHKITDSHHKTPLITDSSHIVTDSYHKTPLITDSPHIVTDSPHKVSKLQTRSLYVQDSGSSSERLTNPSTSPSEATSDSHIDRRISHPHAVDHEESSTLKSEFSEDESFDDNLTHSIVSLSNSTTPEKFNHSPLKIDDLIIGQHSAKKKYNSNLLSPSSNTSSSGRTQESSPPPLNKRISLKITTNSHSKPIKLPPLSRQQSEKTIKSNTTKPARPKLYTSRSESLLLNVSNEVNTKHQFVPTKPTLKIELPIKKSHVIRQISIPRIEKTPPPPSEIQQNNIFTSSEDSGGSYSPLNAFQYPNFYQSVEKDSLGSASPHDSSRHRSTNTPIDRLHVSHRKRYAARKRNVKRVSSRTQSKTYVVRLDQETPNHVVTSPGEEYSTNEALSSELTKPTTEVSFSNCLGRSILTRPIRWLLKKLKHSHSTETNPRVIRDIEMVRSISNADIMSTCSSVSLAKTPSVDGFVACKHYSPGYNSTQYANSRLLQEEQIQAQMRHPNIVRLLGKSDDKDGAKLIFEYVDGDTLQAFIRNNFPLKNTEVTRMMIELMKAVKHIHGKGFVHGDLKTSNILLQRPENSIKVCDFGAATFVGSKGERKLTSDQLNMGTPLYSAPETIFPDADGSYKVTKSSDIYQCGLILYELLVGRTPHHEIASDCVSVFDCIMKLQKKKEQEIMLEIPEGACSDPHLVSIFYMMINLDYKRRPSARQLVDLLHSFDENYDRQSRPISRVSSRSSFY